MAVLRHWPRRAPVPHERGDHVAARMQLGRQIHRLVAPVRHVRPLRAGGHLCAIHEQSIAVVRGYVHDESRWHRPQLEGLSRVEDGEAVAGHAWWGDPAGRRGAVEDRRRLRARRRRRENADDSETARPDAVPRTSCRAAPKDSAFALRHKSPISGRTPVQLPLVLLIVEVPF